MIHPLAEVKTKKIGTGTKVWQYSIVLEGATIGEDCNINCHTYIESKVDIGNRVTIKPGVFVWDGVTLEDDVMIGPNATFTNDKWPRSKNEQYTLLKTVVRKGASIGANATILCGLTIGQYSLIAAGSVITKSVPDRALMVGNPAQIRGWMNLDGTKMIVTNEGFLDNYGILWVVKDGELVK